MNISQCSNTSLMTLQVFRRGSIREWKTIHNQSEHTKSYSFFTLNVTLTETVNIAGKFEKFL